MDGGAPNSKGPATKFLSKYVPFEQQRNSRATVGISSVRD